MHMRILALAVVALLANQSTFAAQLGRSVPPVRQGSQGGPLGSAPATGLQLALIPPVQIFPQDYDVSGLRLSLLYGRNGNVRGLDLGPINQVTGEMEGLQFGLANIADSARGVQFAAVNLIHDAEGGIFQLGAFNKAETMRGFQFGFINIASEAQGLQLGVFNFCETTSGVQIGLLNFITQSDFIIFCPIFNAQF